VHDPAHVGLVDAHAERDRRDDDLDVVAHEGLERFAPHGGIQARVVGQGADAVGLQLRRDFVDAPARQTIDDPGTAFARLRQQFGVAALALEAHLINQIRAVEARHVNRRVAQRQLRNDVGSHARGRRGGKTVDRSRRIALPQQR